MYVISFPKSSYFARLVNLYPQPSFVVLFPVTTCSTGVFPPFNTYLMLVGLLAFAFELSSQTLFTCTSIFSSGTVNVFVNKNSFSEGVVAAD